MDGIGFSWEVRPRAVVVGLSGELDVMTADEVRAGLRPLLQDPPPVTLVILDLNRLAFLASTGMRTLLDVVRELRALEVTVCFVAARHAAAARVLELTGTEEFIDVFLSRQDALVHHAA